MAEVRDGLISEYLDAPLLRERGDRLLFDHLYRLAVAYFELGDYERLSGVYRAASGALQFLREEQLRQVQWKLIQLMEMVMRGQFFDPVREGNQMLLEGAVEMVDMLGRECQLEPEVTQEVTRILRLKLLTEARVQVQRNKRLQTDLVDPWYSLDLKPHILRIIDSVPQSSQASSYVQLLKESLAQETPPADKTNGGEFLHRGHIKEAFLSISDCREAALNTFEVLLLTDVPPLGLKLAQPAMGAAKSSPGPKRREDSSEPDGATANNSVASARVISVLPKQSSPAKGLAGPETPRRVPKGSREEKEKVVAARPATPPSPPPLSPLLLSDSEELLPMRMIVQSKRSDPSTAEAACDDAHQMSTTDFIPSTYEETPPTAPARDVAHPGSTPPILAIIGRKRRSDSPRRRVEEAAATPRLVEDGEVAGPSKPRAATISPAKATCDKWDKGHGHAARNHVERTGRFPGDGFSSAEIRGLPPLMIKDEWSDEEDLFGPSKVAGRQSKFGSSAKKKKMWTETETQCLKEGVAKFGVGNWSKIKRHYSLSRTTVQLKDRWRNISK
ncbi:uncharacterized protein LOC133344107 isoform X2 [Lethenteron reissneri]|uniref:uncharacterized protein LOC133344071 isoform X1 n=1 Tax=Lethenteron reissneri TaxID=7753 RepID=UPI002AB6550E|nr:uncharacterized protein LOC133344071 isoform X1 [Lethenteron reissneri]XP_061410066.1 uncharacterized protein LOC133344107 isoform X2 [Lethenteron reissneri]XP_061410067.1 uncharacterized protein LOC133344107 isoform X2 [Lethenteron reissneri]